MAISKSVLHIFYNSYSEDRPSLFGISSILPFFVDVKESIAGHSEISLITNFGYCKFWVKILPQSEKNLINFVKYVLILFIRICSYLTTPNGPPPPFFFFTSDEEARYPVKLMLFLQIRPLHAFEKKYYNYRKQSGVQIHLVNGILWLKH